MIFQKVWRCLGLYPNKKLVSMMIFTKIFIMLHKLLFVVLGLMFAVSVGASTATVSTLTKATKPTPTQSFTPDSFGRDTPRSTMQGFIHALSEKDTELTLQFLDNTAVKASKEPEKLITDVQRALDRGGRLEPMLNISDTPEGDLADMLPSNEEKVGTIEIGGKDVPLLLTKKMSKDNVVYWQLSAKTLSQIPKAQTALNQTLSNDLITALGLNFLQGTVVFGYDLADMVSLLTLCVAGFLAIWLLVVLIYGTLSFVYPRLTKRRFAIPPKVVVPLSLVLLAYILPELMVQAGVPVTLRSAVTRAKDVVAWLAMAWLVLRLIDAVFRRAEAISVRKNRPEQVSILNLLRKVAKALMVVMAVIIIFGNLGFDLTTGIAALSLGGLALAFGAQKTIENLIGSVVVVADRPVHVGDFCRFGNMEGTVIDIGIRSSRIRTLNRTIVTVPNGEFSAMQLENYTARDMFHFLHNLYLKRDANLDELSRLMTELKSYLLTHPHTNHEWTQVRISEMRQDCFVVEIRCYIKADDVRMFYDKQTELILDVLRQVAGYKVEHALPSQTVNVVQDEPLDK